MILLKKCHWNLFYVLLMGISLSCSRGTDKQESATQTRIDKPNIIFILADDMGYGDPGSFNPESKISTPHIDHLADEGIRFTDAHAAGAWCTPSRYGLVTGHYPLDKSMDWTKGSLIPDQQETIGSLLQEQGYQTACVGKWHLGFDGVNNWDGFDFNKTIHGGPLDHGFDYFFGLHASLDIPPYFYIYNRHAVEAPTDSVDGHQSDYVTKSKKSAALTGIKSKDISIQGAFWRAGRIAPHFKFEQVLPTLTDSSLSFINRQAQKKDQPFLLYFAMSAPHTPWVPTKQFQGKSEAGPYGDFVMEVDYEIGRIIQNLKNLGIDKNTLVVFSSDNGPVWFNRDEKRYGHRSTYIYRGMKADTWEGGHRMPFIVRWPGQIKPGSTSDQLLSFTDMLATFADISGTSLNEQDQHDSFSILPVLTGKGSSKRSIMFEQAKTVRRDQWKYIKGTGLGNLHRTYGDVDASKFKDIEGELYNLKKDPSEKTNLYDQYPQKVDSLKNLMNRYLQ